MNQSRHDLKVGLHHAQQNYEDRIYQVDAHHSNQLHELRQRAQRALEEAELRYKADLAALRHRLEVEQSSSSAAQYHIESLQRNLKHLRDELEMKREEASEVPLLRDTCRHQREELRELQKLKHEVPELRRQLEEAQAAQKKLQEKLRKAEKAKEKAAEKAYEEATASYAGWSGEMPSLPSTMATMPSTMATMPWSEGGYGADAGAYQSGQTEMPTETTMATMASWAPETSYEGYDGFGQEMPYGGEVHWAQQGVEGDGSLPWSEEQVPQVKEKKKKKHRDKKSKKHEEHGMEEFESVSTAPTMANDAFGETDGWGTVPTGGEATNIDAQVKMLKDMGFDDENRVRVVLEAVGNDVEKAVPVLLSDL